MNKFGTYSIEMKAIHKAIVLMQDDAIHNAKSKLDKSNFDFKKKK